MGSAGGPRREGLLLSEQVGWPGDWDAHARSFQGPLPMAVPPVLFGCLIKESVSELGLHPVP